MVIEIPKQLKNEDFRFIKLNGISKAPLPGKAWLKDLITWQEAEKWLNEGNNIGIVGGYGELRLLDVDKSAVEKGIADKVFELLQTFTVRTGNGGYHFYFISGYDKNHPFGEDLGELRANNQYVVCVGSTHPETKEKYTIVNDLPVFEMDEGTIKRIIKLFGGSIKSKDEELVVSPLQKPLRVIPDYLDKMISEGTKKGQRNINAYKIIKELNNRGFSKEEIIGQLFIFNNNCIPKKSEDVVKNHVTYVLNHADQYLVDKVDEKWLKAQNWGGEEEKEKVELEVIDIDQFFDEDEKGNKKFNYKRFSDFLSEQHIFKTTIDNETVYVNDSFFRPIGEIVIKSETEKILKKYTRNQLVNEVLGHIKRSTYIDRKEFNNNINLINLKNGVFNIETKEFTPTNPEFLFTYALPIIYNPEADCPNIKKFLSEILYSQDIPFIQEWFGFSLFRDYFIKSMFIAFGDTDAGKTTLFNLVETFIGAENISHKSLQDLTYNRFAPVELYNKHLNIRDDLPDEEISNTGIIKQVTGESTISGEKKGKDAFDFTSFAKMMFAANKLPEVKGDSAFWNRANGLITFPYKFVDNPNPDNMNEKKKISTREIKKKICTEEEMSGLFNWALEGFYRLRENNTFTGTRSVEEAEKFWNLNSSPVAAFCEERVYIKAEKTLDKKTLYGKYVDFCNLKKLPAMGYDAFCKKLLGHYGSALTDSQKAGDKRVRIWNGISLKEEKYCKICGFVGWVREEDVICQGCCKECDLIKTKKDSVICIGCDKLLINKDVKHNENTLFQIPDIKIEREREVKCV